MNRLAWVAGAVILALPAYAQAPGQSGAQEPAQKADSNTVQFVEKAAIGDMFEIQSSELALDKSQSEEVRNFAQRIIDDHTKSSEKMKSIVGNMQGVQVPQQLDSKHRDMMDKLQSASGQQFHQLYRSQQLAAHKEAVQLFEDYSKNGQNKELQQFASETLPALKEHQQMAQKLPERIEGQAVGQAPQQGQGAAQKPRAQAQGGQAMQPIAKPGPEHILSSDLVGTTVYGAKNENIGEIDEIVLDRQGQLVAIIVGVGGFLGIGEKNVAIPFEALEIAAAGTGDQGQTGTGGGTGTADNRGAQSDTSAKGTTEPQRIVLRGMTREDLEKAPAFESDDDQADQNRSGRQ